jgi:hypothetical protein
MMQGGYRKRCVVCDVGKLRGGVRLNKEGISVKGPLVRGSEHVLCREGIYKKKLGGITCDLFTLAYTGHVCTATGISIWGAVNPYKVSSRLSSSASAFRRPPTTQDSQTVLLKRHMCWPALFLSHCTVQVGGGLGRLLRLPIGSPTPNTRVRTALCTYYWHKLLAKTALSYRPSLVGGCE